MEWETLISQPFLKELFIRIGIALILVVVTILLVNITVEIYDVVESYFPGLQSAGSLSAGGSIPGQPQNIYDDIFIEEIWMKNKNSKHAQLFLPPFCVKKSGNEGLQTREKRSRSLISVQNTQKLMKKMYKATLGKKSSSSTGKGTPTGEEVKLDWTIDLEQFHLYNLQLARSHKPAHPPHHSQSNNAISKVNQVNSMGPPSSFSYPSFNPLQHAPTSATSLPAQQPVPRTLHHEDYHCTPLVCFINAKSGGQQGLYFQEQLLKLLNPYQVIDLSKLRPLPTTNHHLTLILKEFAKLPTRLKVLICGGDGTITWIMDAIQAIETFQTTDRKPEVAILPIGTGNDLANELGWLTVMENHVISGILEKILKSQKTLLDRWQLSIHPSPPLASKPKDKKAHKKAAQQDQQQQSSSKATAKKKSKSSDGEAVASAVANAVSTSLLPKELSVKPPPLPSLNITQKNFQNYLGIGVDAQIVLQFHLMRTYNPKIFFHQYINKFFYGIMGWREIWKQTCEHLPRYLELYHNGKRIHLPSDTQGIVFLNIQSYGGGSVLWKDASSNHPNEEGMNTETSSRMGSFSYDNDFNSNSYTNTTSTYTNDYSNTNPSTSGMNTSNNPSCSTSPQPMFHHGSGSSTRKHASLLRDLILGPESDREDEEGYSYSRQRNDDHSAKGAERSRSTSPVRPPSQLSPPRLLVRRPTPNESRILEQGGEQSFQSTQSFENNSFFIRKPNTPESRRRHFQPVSCSDGLLEVVAVKSSFELAQVKLGITSCHKLFQGHSFEIVIKQPVPVQIDGEPWIQQSPCKLSIQLLPPHPSNPPPQPPSSSVAPVISSTENSKILICKPVPDEINVDLLLETLDTVQKQQIITRFQSDKIIHEYIVKLNQQQQQLQQQQTFF